MDIDSTLLDAEDRMEKALAALDRDFAKLRTGRASTALVDGIKADYYGTPTPVSQMASVAVPDSRTLTIQPWDKGGIAAVEKPFSSPTWDLPRSTTARSSASSFRRSPRNAARISSKWPASTARRPRWPCATCAATPTTA